MTQTPDCGYVVDMIDIDLFVPNGMGGHGDWNFDEREFYQDSDGDRTFPHMQLNNLPFMTVDPHGRWIEFDVCTYDHPGLRHILSDYMQVYIK